MKLHNEENIKWTKTNKDQTNINTNDVRLARLLQLKIFRNSYKYLEMLCHILEKQ
uniref:Uncharacterized protein n=1 Tax=Rhizophora mucronata TaxID=61149 RepID=A0A2P2QTS0_RHIMU